RLRIDLAQFRELAAFAQFASDLDEETKQRIVRGRLLTEVLKQNQYAPLSVAEQVVTLIAATSGAFDHLESREVATAVHDLLTRIKKAHAKLIDSLNTGQKPEEKDTEQIIAVAREVAKTFGKER